MRKRIKLFLVLCFMLAGIVLPGRDVRASEVQAPEEYSDYTKVDVTKYGADRKGGKNAQNAFKNAVAAVEAMQEEGKKALVYLPSGTYRLDNYVAVRGSEIIFLAESDVVVNAKSAINVQVGGTAIVKGGTWVYSGSKSDKKNLFFANKDTRIELSNLKIKKAYKAVHLTEAAGSLKNLKVENSHYIAVAATKNSNVTISNCKFNKNDMAVMISASKAVCDNITVTNSKNMGMESIEKSKVTVKNSTFTTNGSGYKPGKNTYKGHGMGVYTKSKVTVENCTFSNNVQCGISLQGGDVVVNNSQIVKNGRQGIGTREKCNVTATNTTIKGNGRDTREISHGNHGVIIVNGSKGTFTKCKISDNKFAGIWVDGGGSSVTVKQCEFKGNKEYPIQLTCKKGKVTLVSNNCTYKNSKHGVWFVLQGSAKYKLTKKGTNKFSNTPDKFMLNKGGKVKKL